MKGWRNYPRADDHRRVGSALGNAPGLSGRADLRRPDRHDPETRKTRSAAVPAGAGIRRTSARPPTDQKVGGSNPFGRAIVISQVIRDR